MESVDFFPQYASPSSGFVAANASSCDDGRSVGLLEHGVEFRAAEMKGAPVWTLKEVGMPNPKCCFLKLTPCICTELSGTVEALNESLGTVKGLDLIGGQGFHYAAY